MLNLFTLLARLPVGQAQPVPAVQILLQAGSVLDLYHIHTGELEGGLVGGQAPA